jgi:dolichol-phosphate mannosyltransferase
MTGSKNAEIKKFTVAIPSYMEEENLRILLPRLRKVLSEQNESYDILVIDTKNPMDNTGLVCKENNVRYINRECGDYYGDSVRTAIKYCTSQFIIFMDGDGSHSPEFIPKLLNNTSNFDVVIASRYIKGGASDNSLHLILMSRFVNLCYSLVLGLKCKDVSNSFKLYRMQLLEGINLSCKNFDIIEEILFKLKKTNKNLRIKEIPFNFKERMFGHTKRNLIVFMFSFVFTLLKLRFSK